jgi:hypothetical protein
MLTKKIRIVCAGAAVAGASLLSGCLTAPFEPPMGMIFSDVKAPLMVDYDKAQVSPKSGKAESICILGLVTTGDNSIQAAAAQGGIQTIEHVDYHYFNVIGVYQKTTVVVFGQ